MLQKSAGFQKGLGSVRGWVCKSIVQPRPYLLRSLRPRLGQGASWRARVGQVRRSLFWASCGMFSIVLHVWVI